MMNGVSSLRSRVNAILVLIICGMALALFFYWRLDVRLESAKSRFERQKAYAAELLAYDLTVEAIEVMEQALAYAPFSDESLRLRRVLADVRMNKIGDYEKALADLVFIKTVKPGEAAALEPDIRRCLDRLGRAYDVQRRLLLEAGINPTVPAATETTIVRFGNEVGITAAELEQRLLRENLPLRGAPRQAIDRVIQSMLTEKLLLRAAKRAGIDRRPDVLEQVKRFEENLALLRYLEENVMKDIEVDEQTLNLYIENNRNRFQKPLKVIYSVLEFADQSQAESYISGTLSSPSRILSDHLAVTTDELPASLRTVKWETAPIQGPLGPVNIDGKWLVYEIHQVIPPEPLPQELVRQQARLELLERKKGDRLASAVAELAGLEDVRIIDSTIENCFKPASGAANIEK